MSVSEQRTETAPRVARHRRKLTAAGGRRLEVVVPAADADLVREAAAVLRAGGENARRLRRSLRAQVHPRAAATGDELLAFFRASPLVGEDLTIERDRSPGRPVDLPEPEA